MSLQLGHVSLRHSLTVPLPPPGYSSSRPFVFALQLPNGGVYLFQAATGDVVRDWVAVCNYWAARESKEPLPGGIDNRDYGWGRPTGENQNRPVILPEWNPPQVSMLRSILEEVAFAETLIS